MTTLQDSKQKKADHMAAMVRLWKRLGEALGSAFLNQYGVVGEDTFETWSASLADLSVGQIKAGFVNYMRSDDRYIDLKRFRVLCLDMTAYGLPEPELAYREAAGHCHEWRTWEFSHPAVAKALLETGLAVMREYTEKSSKPVFLRNYQILCRKVMTGESIESPIPKALPEKISRPASPETAEKYIGLINGMFV